MLTYEYECQACGHRFERLQRIVDPPIRRCPACDGDVERLIGAGGGFIVKDGAARSGGRPGGNHTGCALEATGTTCCGRETRCGSPQCGGGD